MALRSLFLLCALSLASLVLAGPCDDGVTYNAAGLAGNSPLCTSVYSLRFDQDTGGADDSG
jgi:hypothetical protein